MGWRDKLPDNYIHLGDNYFILVDDSAFVERPTVSVRSEYWPHLFISSLPSVATRHESLQFHIRRYEGEAAFILAVVKSKFEDISRCRSHIEPHNIKEIHASDNHGRTISYLVKGRYSTNELAFSDLAYEVSERQPAATLNCPICSSGEGKAKIVFDHPGEWFHDKIASCEDCVDHKLSRLQEEVAEAEVRKRER